MFHNKLCDNYFIVILSLYFINWSFYKNSNIIKAWKNFNYVTICYQDNRNLSTSSTAPLCSHLQVRVFFCKFLETEKYITNTLTNLNAFTHPESQEER